MSALPASCSPPVVRRVHGAGELWRAASVRGDRETLIFASGPLLVPFSPGVWSFGFFWENIAFRVNPLSLESRVSLYGGLLHFWVSHHHAQNLHFANSHCGATCGRLISSVGHRHQRNASAAHSRQCRECAALSFAL